MSYEIRQKIDDMPGTSGHRSPDHMEYMQISLAFVLANCATRLKQSIAHERKHITQDGQFIWRGTIPEYRDPVTVGMLLDISALINELIAAQIINIKIDDE